MIQLEVLELEKRFGSISVLKNLSFIHRQGVLGIAGPNGCGKSTLLKCLCFLLKPTKGKIIWTDNGKELSTGLIKPLIGFAAPYLNLYANLSVTENLEFICKISSIDRSKQTIGKLISFTGLEFLKDQSYGSLSTGQQQRVKLAVSLLRDPEILMLDEPGSNLDEAGKQLVSSIVDESREKGRLLIIASNDPAEIGYCDQVINLTGRP